jgi:hypothetical protein
MMNKCPYIGSEVLIAVVINSSVLWKSGDIWRNMLPPSSGFKSKLIKRPP